MKLKRHKTLDALLIDALHLLLEILMMPVAFIIGALPIIAIAVLIGLVSMLVGCDSLVMPVSQEENDAYWEEVDASAQCRDAGVCEDDSTRLSVQAYRDSSAFWREDKNGEIWIHANGCNRWIGYGERAWEPIPTAQAAYWIDKQAEITNQPRHKWDFSEMVNIDGRPIFAHGCRVRWKR